MHCVSILQSLHKTSILNKHSRGVFIGPPLQIHLLGRLWTKSVWKRIHKDWYNFRPPKLQMFYKAQIKPEMEYYSHILSSGHKQSHYH